MKTFKTTVLIAFLMLFFNACEKEKQVKEDVEELVDNADQLKRALLSVIAKKIDVEAFKELHTSIARTKAFGLDEIAFSNELFAETNEKFNGAPIAKKLVSLFKNRGERVSVRNSAGRIMNFGYFSLEEIKESGLQFYWPNHELWDGVTVPLIGTTEGEGDLVAYERLLDEDGHIKLVEVLMTEEDAKKRPVVIIGPQEIDYELVEDENVVFVMADDYETLDVGMMANESPKEDTGRDIYTLYLGSFQAINLHEEWKRGGPEFMIHFAGTEDFEIKTDADTARVKNYTSKMLYVINLTRSEANERKMYDFGKSKPLLTSWSPELNFGHLLIREDDGGKEHDLKFNIGFKYKGISFGIEDSFTVNKADDIIVDMSLHKDFLQSTGNGYNDGKWTLYNSNDVYYTLPFIKNRVYD